jgi:hypothetical protein
MNVGLRGIVIEYKKEATTTRTELLIAREKEGAGHRISSLGLPSQESSLRKE